MTAPPYHSRRAELSETVRLALPIMAGMLSHMLIGLADTVMLGRVGVTALAGAAFVHTVVHPPFIFAVGMLSAVAVLTSQSFGAKRYHECGEALRNGLAVSLFTGLCIVGAIYLGRPALNHLGQPPEVVDASGAYLLLFSWSFLPALIAHSCKQFSEALNHPWAPNHILLMGVLLNVLLNWIFIYGNLGAPALGLEGAGWATLLSRLFTAIAMVAYIIRSAKLSSFHPVRWFSALVFAQTKRLLSVGTPAAFQHLLEVAAFAFAGLMIGWINADSMAAHQVALTCAATAFMFPLGLGMALCIRLGHAFGAGEYLRLRRIGSSGFALAASIMAASGIIFVVFRYPIGALFVSSPEVLAITTQLFLVAALFQVVDGLQVTAINALRGLSDVRVPAFIAIFAYWVIAVPLGYFLGFPLKLGATGVWVGLAAGLGCAAFFLLLRFYVKTRSLAQTL